MRLEGKEIYLRFLEINDAPDVAAYRQRNRDFFRDYLVSQPEEFYSVDFQAELIKNGLAQMENDQKYAFGVFLKETDELIGLLSLTEVVRDAIQACWLGYSLDQAYNGRGYTTEAVRLVVEYAFNNLQLHRVEAGVMPHNIRSIRVLEKAGFEKEGLNRKNVMINGKWEDHLHFAIVNPNDK
ncbi:MAG: GNAT family N-acetyltransferase [Tuberibacillus sp.]